MTLRHHLDQSAHFDAEYGHNLASHLPMTLVALWRLGADEAQVTRFVAQYTQRLHPAPAAEAWPSGEAWGSQLGNPRAWPAYRSLFNDWLDDEGGPSVLPQVLPVLLQGVGAAAFHGLIRTAYALAAGHSHALADALAYWACRWVSLGPSGVGAEGAGRRQRDPRAVLTRFRPIHPSTPSLIVERMVVAASQPGFAAAASGLLIDGDDTLSQLATLAARCYAASGDFTVLHLVTSAHALRVLLPWLEAEEKAEALGHYWLNYAAGYVGSGLAGKPALPSMGKPWPWARIVEATLSMGDDHAIKLVDSCREQERVYGGDAWRVAASRAAGQRLR